MREQGRQGGAGEEITNAPYPMPTCPERSRRDAQCPMPNAPCPMPNAQCPIPNFTQIFLKNLNIWYTSLVFLKKS
ncbi:hypothetical protein [Nostoc sp. CHAB 5715]|uniref:hypothetical protein n=1 Tax=Nostoc sp. CHAB 5715 TaxID=2780400 RepID=UPI001E5E01E4|nr:hypothetical protein [Nostoc sp. CHAB 5715]MCC5623131.1 hypothetical protein [Nostoc sp. CHAB 5715]